MVCEKSIRGKVYHFMLVYLPLSTLVDQIIKQGCNLMSQLRNLVGYTFLSLSSNQSTFRINYFFVNLPIDWYTIHIRSEQNKSGLAPVGHGRFVNLLYDFSVHILIFTLWIRRICHPRFWTCTLTN